MQLAGTTTSDSFSAGASTLSGDHDESEEEKDQERRTVVSLLDRLKSASAVGIARSRKTKMNEPPHGKRQFKGAVSSDPKGVSPQHCVREFTNESFTDLHGHLFCTACRKRLSLKRSILKNHVQSAKHQKSQQRIKHKEARQQDIAASLRKYNKDVHSMGESLQVYRVNVVSSFLKAGVP